ncbi:MAG TPA: tRNA (N(6)-L-threonylcarbamoyladenosine(37)-C(2))-methylthiotransferase MtaB [Caulobacteraceae bacterium]|jgi:threonylcarbamoyladenosine tRNA methylthiotransferase MtaB|nr:tRNA (N(6)-L-threonylcarbamoyladenosine(37)-C(2))-methylthiotransferase MtaB [Caulobacteraceae bacterium]
MSDAALIEPPAAANTLDVVTFGCRLNACESEAIAARARAEGVRDTVVFNTCAVTGEAVRQARQAIRKTRRERPGARLVVTGCAAQIDPAPFAAMAEVDLVLGNAEKAAPGALTTPGDRVRVGDIFKAAASGAAAGAFAGRARAYVEVQNGCDHRCTFCIIPFGRGAARSTPAAEIAARVAGLARAGVNEVVLTGVDLTSWGADLDGAPALGDLVRQILREVPELPRLRLSSIDAAEIDAELLACFGQERRLMPHLHLSLQAGDDLILKRMKRRHSRAQALDLIASVRAVRPGLAIGADLIAGFPTESDAAFERTLDFVTQADLAFLHVFPFSPRPGTPAARMPQVPGAVVRERAARLRAAGEAGLSRRLNASRGVRASALVEAPGRARAEDYLELAFTGEAAAGSLIAGVIGRADGRRAELLDWRRAGGGESLPPVGPVG